MCLRCNVLWESTVRGQERLQEERSSRGALSTYAWARYKTSVWEGHQDKLQALLCLFE